MHALGSVCGRMLVMAIMNDRLSSDKMRVVQIGDLTHDLHLSIFPFLVSDRRSEPIINHYKNWSASHPTCISRDCVTNCGAL